MVEYTDSNGVECVIVENKDGSIWSGLKSAYEKQQAENESNQL